MKQLSRVIFDFDNTLIRTEVIKDILRTAATGIYGFTATEADQIYREALTQDGKAAFTVDRFQELLKKHLPPGRKGSDVDMDRVKEDLQQLGAQLLVPGAGEFLQEVKEKELDHYLLSLGEPGWQQQKMSWAGLKKVFVEDHVFYTTDMKIGKTEALRQMFGKDFRGENTVLFNDKPDETAGILTSFPDIVTFLRQDDKDRRYRQEDFEQLADQFPDRVVFSSDFSELSSEFRAAYWDEPRETRSEFNRLK